MSAFIYLPTTYLIILDNIVVFYSTYLPIKNVYLEFILYLFYLYNKKYATLQW